MVSREIWRGVDALLDDYLHISDDDVMLVLYTSDSKDCAIWVSAALELRCLNVKRVWMAPLVDADFPQRLQAALPTAMSAAQRLVILSFERDTMSHSSALKEALTRYDVAQRVVYRVISASAEFFTHAMKVTPQQLTARNAAILERLMSAQRLRIKTAGGSDVAVQLDNMRHRWISNRGIARQGGVVVLPAGEVATYPASVSGVFVADFAFNVNAITGQDARLDTTPVTVWIESGRAVRWRCDGPAISKFLDDCFQTQCAFNVGELGFGTNFGVTDALAMNSHINERRPGVHFGFGQHNQDPGVVHYQCALHLDLIARGGRIWVDEDPEPIDLENLAPPAKGHPAHPRDEDVFTPGTPGHFETEDCCGTVTASGLQVCTALAS